LDNTDAAKDLVVLLVLPLLRALEALEATGLLVLTEFFAMDSPPFWRAFHHSEGGHGKTSVKQVYHTFPQMSIKT
jgi:hypothetical protein